jgi:hypothetical protein
MSNREISDPTDILAQHAADRRWRHQQQLLSIAMGDMTRQTKEEDSVQVLGYQLYEEVMAKKIFML